jgi:hypothetical protein
MRQRLGGEDGRRWSTTQVEEAVVDPERRCVRRDQGDLAEDTVKAGQRLRLHRFAAGVEERQAVGGEDDGVVPRAADHAIGGHVATRHGRAEPVRVIRQVRRQG